MQWFFFLRITCFKDVFQTSHFHKIIQEAYKSQSLHLKSTPIICSWNNKTDFYMLEFLQWCVNSPLNCIALMTLSCFTLFTGNVLCLKVTYTDYVLRLLKFTNCNIWHFIKITLKWNLIIGYSCCYLILHMEV